MKNSKDCSKCREHKTLDEFHLSAKSSTGRASWCKACANSAIRASRKRTYIPANKRKWQLKTRYGLTPEAVDQMLAAQAGKCALCNMKITKHHVDHCHNTGRVRGLLCHQCNIRLGGWDDIAWRTKALVYLGIAA